jgi:hypothetical protein
MSLLVYDALMDARSLEETKMKVKQWPNKLGMDVTVKGRTWECAEANGQWHARLAHNGTWKSDRIGSGQNWMLAIANAKQPANNLF